MQIQKHFYRVEVIMIIFNLMKQEKISKKYLGIAQKEKNGKRNELHILDTGHFQLH